MIMEDEVLKRLGTSLGGGFLFFGAYVISPFLFGSILILICLFILFYECPRLYSSYSSYGLRVSLGWALCINAYICSGFAALLYLLYWYRFLHWFIPLYPFIGAWVFDTAAYCSGTLWGNHKICPSISPKKTWEGLLGGFCAVLIFHLFIVHNNPLLLFALSGSCSALAFGGDLFESYLKRRAHIKDVGSILPGHGGMFDRFDSVIAVALGCLISQTIWACLHF